MVVRQDLVQQSLLVGDSNFGFFVQYMVVTSLVSRGHGACVGGLGLKGEVCRCRVGGQMEQN